MKAVLIFCLAVIALSYARHVRPTHNYQLAALQNQYYQQHGRRASLKSVSDLFKRLHLAQRKRCANLFDESCSNGGLPDGSSDDDWINGGGGPGKRCANLFDESCSNGDIPDGNSDDDWIHGGGGPGKRCANLFDESCSNGDIPDGNSDDDWINGGGGPGK